MTVSIAAITVALLFTFNVISCNGGKSVRVDETKNETTENITKNCWVFIMLAAKKGRWHEASNAMCFCQQHGGTGATAQNNCKTSMGIVNFRGAFENCLFMTTKKTVIIEGVELTIHPPMTFKKCLEKGGPGWN